MPTEQKEEEAVKERTTEEKAAIDVDALIQALENAVREAVTSGQLGDLPRRVDDILENAVSGVEQERAEAVINEVRLAVRAAADDETLEDVDSLVDKVTRAVRDFFGKSSGVAGSVGSSVKDRIRSTVETVRGVGRENVVMIRVNSESREHMDQLIEAGLVGSRSEAAAFLIAEGIKSREDLFAGIATHIGTIRKAKEELQRILNDKS